MSDTTAKAPGRLATLWAVLRQPNLRPLVLSWFLFVIVENTTWMGVLVYAHDQGGAAEVGVVAVVQLIPAMLIAPLASFAGDRFDRVRVLVVSNAAVGVGALLVALAIALDLSSIVVYAASVVLVVLVTFPPPAVSALTPGIVSSGEQLTALNVCIGLTRSIGRAAGPLAGGVLLALGGPAWIFWAAVGASTLAAVFTLFVRTTATVVDEDERVSLSTVGAEIVAGFRLLGRERGPRRIVTVLGAGSIVYGALDVAAVVVALEHLDGGDGLTGVLSAAIGIGGILGAASSVVLVGRRRIAPAVLAAGLLQVLPMLGFVLPPFVVVAFAVFALSGAGVSLIEIAGQTLLQGVTPDDLLARVFGVLEGLRLAGFALGSFAISMAFAHLGVEWGSVVFVALAVGALVLQTPGLLRVDRERPEVDQQLLALVRSVPIFAPLPAYTVEQLLQSFRRVEFPSGAVVMAEGDEGDAIYLVAEGTLTVTYQGRFLRQCGVGDYLGEVALLFDRPRTATVTAAVDCVLHRLERDAFLEAITGHPRSTSRAQSQASKHLATVDEPTES